MQGESSEHGTMLFTCLSSLYHQLMPRVRLLLVKFTLPDVFVAGEGVDVCVHPQGCGLKVVQVDI